MIGQLWCDYPFWTEDGMFLLRDCSICECPENEFPEPFKRPLQLWCDCPFWTEDGMFLLRDCSICECPEKEFPEPFKRRLHRGLTSDSLVCQEEKLQGSVDRTLDSRVFRGWIDTDNPWIIDDENDNGEMTYVNLLLNPERYTGYAGPSARRIWDAVYSENCPKYSTQDICQEQGVLYKLISGLHSSISIHIAADYLLDKITNLEDLLELEMVKEKNVKRWVLVGAVVVVLLAIALTSTRDFNSKLNLSLFFKNPSSCQCPQDSKKYSGIDEDCCCDYETVDSVNAEVLHPLLQEIVKTPFFRYFKAKLWCDCPFWTEDGMCLLRDCSVCECPENEFPEPFKRPFHGGLPSDTLVCQDDKLQGSVDRTLDGRAFRGWIETDNPWTNDDETDNDEMTYVNLLLNPERYTGYTGPSARRIWDAVYSENCPKYSSQDICQEQRVLYKLISGLHSSISIHIAADYLLDKITNLWGQNMELMHDRVLKYPDRVQNLYFAFLFVLRAVTKAADYLEQAEYDTGNHEEDLRTESLMRQLLYNPKLQAACPLPFDEAKLWKGQSGPQLKQQIQKKFRNISALMDCVGCEKCRLWGKLQVLGLGTALKILFSVDGKNHQDQPLQLQRNEVIALVNLLNRLSESVKYACQSRHSIKKVAEGGRVVEPYSIQPISTLQRIWEAVIPIRLRLGMLAL